ncbi:MAG: pyruvate kinase [bacterium]
MKRLKEFGNTKIVCTIGPASQEVDVLLAMIDAGMDVVRLNFSHGTHEQHLYTIEQVKEASKRSGEHITLLQDLSGPKIRTGKFENNRVELKAGSSFTFTIDDILGNADRVSTTYKPLPRDVVVGDIILVDDGKMKFVVESKTDTTVQCKVVTGGILSDKKGMNLPGVKVSVPSFTEKDIDDLKFGLAHDVDYVALSFVRSADDIRQLREIVIREAPPSKKVPIIAKIEKEEAVNDIDAVIREADVIMVARGDLGVEMAPEDVPVIQKMIVRKCNEAGRPVIVATQMLESMIDNPRPTRAEANDVANAVLDGADAVMLSGETSVGKYPVEAVNMMDRIIRRAEENHSDMLDIVHHATNDEERLSDGICRAACVLAQEIGAKAIVVITHSGSTAMQVAKYRPCARVIAATDREKILRRLNLIWGIRGIVLPDLVGETDHAFVKVTEALKGIEYLESGDYVVYTAGIPLLTRGTTNTVKVEKAI